VRDDGTATAVVLVNLGTPDSPTPGAVRRYLREFLSDRRIVPLAPVLWQPILNGIVLPIRGRKSARKYASIWTDAGSPLLVHTVALASALAERLDGEMPVAVAMRYGEPRLSTVLDKLIADGVRRVLVVPLYPQYSTTTTATVLDALAQYLAAKPSPAEYRTVHAWHDDPAYIDAAARRIEATWASAGRPDFARGDKLLLSFHGIPLAAVRGGDPYPDECAVTARMLRERLGLDEDACPATFQSKFGPGEWLRPATIVTVGELARTGVERVDVFCPGFVADCLETEEEIGMLNRDAFHANGGRQFVRVPCVNDDAPWVDALAGIVRRHLADWE